MVFMVPKIRRRKVIIITTKFDSRMEDEFIYDTAAFNCLKSAGIVDVKK